MRCVRCDHCLTDIETGNWWAGTDIYEPVDDDESDDESYDPQEDAEYTKHFCSHSCAARWHLDQIVLEAPDGQA